MPSVQAFLERYHHAEDFQLLWLTIHRGRNKSCPMPRASPTSKPKLSKADVPSNLGHHVFHRVRAISFATAKPSVEVTVLLSRKIGFCPMEERLMP